MGLSFNLLMSRGCDTLYWYILMQVVSFCIIIIPFLPSSLLNMFLVEVDYHD